MVKVQKAFTIEVFHASPYVMFVLGRKANLLIWNYMLCASFRALSLTSDVPQLYNESQQPNIIFH